MADAPVSRGALPQEIADAIEDYVERRITAYECLNGEKPAARAEDARAHLEGLILKHIQGEAPPQ